jgi:hypothetical protein
VRGSAHEADPRQISPRKRAEQKATRGPASQSGWSGSVKSVSLELREDVARSLTVSDGFRRNENEVDARRKRAILPKSGFALGLGHFSADFGCFFTVCG